MTEEKIITQAENWQQVRLAWSKYMQEEAVDRGYKADLAEELRQDYQTQKRTYEGLWGAPWNENDEIGKVTLTSVTSHSITIGHNNPPPDVVEALVVVQEGLTSGIRERHAEVLRVATKLATAKNTIKKTCDTQEYAERLTKFVKNVNICLKVLDAARKAEKRPFKEMSETVDRLFKPFEQDLELVKNQAANLQTKFLMEEQEKERKRRIEAAEILRKEAEAQRETSAALESAGREQNAVDTARVADRIERHADHLEETAERKTAEVAQVKGGGASASLRTKWEGEIMDYALLDLNTLRPYIPRDALQKALNSYIATGARELPGARIFETNRAVTR